MILVVDANVLVAATRREEVHHAASRRFLHQASAGNAMFACPALVLPECAAAVARGTGGAPKAQDTLRAVRALHGLRLVVPDLRMWGRAAQVAIGRRLRGADAVYVAVAEATGAILITWDAEMLARGPALVPTMTPTDWLAQHAPGP